MTRINCIPFQELTTHIPEKFYGDWKPDHKAMEINRARIKERLK